MVNVWIFNVLEVYPCGVAEVVAVVMRQHDDVEPGGQDEQGWFLDERKDEMCVFKYLRWNFGIISDMPPFESVRIPDVAVILWLLRII